MKTKINKEKLLITGVSGVLGNNLAFYLRDRYDILGLYGSNSVSIEGIVTQKADLLFPQEIQTVIQQFSPKIIIHCAAKANVDECEENPEIARKVNIEGTKVIVEAIAGTRTKLIYISTDSVYDGLKNDYEETDSPRPLSVYARSKYAAEEEALKNNNALVVRTAFFGWDIQNRRAGLAEWIIDHLSQGKSIPGFQDVYTSLIYTFKLAELFDQAIQKDLRGIYHFVSKNSMSKYQFAVNVADIFGFDPSLVKAASVKNSGLKAYRPYNLRLRTDKLSRDLGIELPTIEDSLQQFYQDFKSRLPQIIRSNRTFHAAYPQLDFIPYGRQSIDEEDIQAVVDVLKSRHVTQGPKVGEFESKLCQSIGSRMAVAVSSGTAALHIACLAAGVGEGDEVITSPNTFVASANCVAFCRATPVFADIDPKTYNLSPQELKKKITAKTKAIIPVHFAGQSCNMSAIFAVRTEAEKEFGHKIFIIEDASHALGSKYNGLLVGSCSLSDMAVMSFHPVKHITTAEGGAVLTNDPELFRKLKFFRSHGISNAVDSFVYRDQGYSPSSNKPGVEILNPWYYEQILLGYNYRITDLQCALGVSQLKKLEAFRTHRREIVHLYNEAFKDIPYMTTPFEAKECDSNFHLYVLLFDFPKIGISRAEMMHHLNKNQKIQTQVHYIPVHTQPFYQKTFHTKWGDCPQAERYYQQCLSLPLFPGMSDQEQNTVIREVKSILNDE